MFIELCCLALLSVDNAGTPTFSEKEWDVVQSLSPAIVEKDTTNKYEHNENAALLGQALFFDTRFSSNKQVSCATCHTPEKYFTDGRAVAEGIQQTTRNTPTVLNAAHQRWFFWDGRADTLWGQPIQTMEHPDEMNMSREEVVTLIEEDKKLTAVWKSAFNETEPNDINSKSANVAKALAAYITKLEATNAPFDAFVLGDKNAISISAQRGLKYFITDGGCLRCHFGPWFTDGAFHSVGVGPLDGGPLRDSGRAGAIEQLQKNEFTAGSPHSDNPESMRAVISKHIAKRREDWGAFRTPSLRNVEKTAPYMHAGQLSTLEDVLDHYSTLEHFVSADHHRETILEPLHLTPIERDDLQSFLKSLTAPLPKPALLSAPVLPQQ
ncbi:MAG: cytochrome c peroxidase [Phycisphaerales bacterium]|jgi:cytochrome c peroxidase